MRKVRLDLAPMRTAHDRRALHLRTSERRNGVTPDAINLTYDCCQLLSRGTKPTLLEVRPLIDRYYALPNNLAGGELHVVLDGHNIKRHHIVWCRDRAELPETRALADVLLLLSNSQRRRM